LPTEVVRTLACYLAAREPGTEVPPRDLLGPAHVRQPAFIYSTQNITGLIQAARALGPAEGLRPATYATLVGLLACTGLRIGEALALRTNDINWSTAVLSVRAGKFHKARLVPVHASAIEPLRSYAAARERRHPPLADSTFFVGAAGLAPAGCCAQRSARSTVRWVAFSRSAKAAKLCSRRPGPLSWKPRLRRSRRYSSTACRSWLIARLP
jgi:integrase